MFFRVKAGSDPKKGRHIIAMHIINADDPSHALQVDRYRRISMPKIKAGIVQSEPKIKVSGDQEAVSIFEFVLPFVLPAKTAAMIEVTLKDVSAVNCQEIKGNLGLLRRRRQGEIFLRPSPNDRHRGDGQDNSKQADQDLHVRS